MIAIKKHAEILGFLYALAIVIISFLFTSERVFFTSPDTASSTGPPLSSYRLPVSPLVGRRNASSVISSQVNRVKLQFERILTDPSCKWQVLRSVPSVNLTVSVHYSDLKDENGSQHQHPYVKTTIFIESSPKEVYKLFLWRHLHDTLSVIDPLYESSELVSKVSANTNIVRKMTKRLIVFPKREFFLAYSLLDQRTSIHIDEYHKIPSRSQVASFVNLRLDQDDYKEYRNSADYVQASQDYFVWFSKIKMDNKDGGVKDASANDVDDKEDDRPSKECTLITTISRVDLSISVPRWPLETAMGNIAAGSMLALKKLAENQ